MSNLPMCYFFLVQNNERSEYSYTILGGFFVCFPGSVLFTLSFVFFYGMTVDFFLSSVLFLC